MRTALVSIAASLCLAVVTTSAETRTPIGSVVTINSDQVLVMNGRKVFPITLSPGPELHRKTPAGKDALQEFREAGATMIRMPYATDWTSEVASNYQAALDWAHSQDMFCLFNLRELSAFKEGDTAAETRLREIVNRFKNHPAVGVWKNKDEAWWGKVSAADLQRGYDVIREADPNHPVEQTHAPRGTLADLVPYNHAADILALDIYPIGYPPGANSLLANKEISMTGDWTRFLNQVGGGKKHFWMVEQIAWSGVLPPKKTLRYPTFPQVRFMSYQAIINGARGLMFFGGNIPSSLNSRDAALGWNWTYWEKVLRPLVSELGDKGMLAEALVAPVAPHAVRISGAADPELEFCVREAPPYFYLLASKREGATIQVTFSGLPDWSTTGELLYEEPRTVTSTNGTFTDWFAPFEVHAYRFKRPSTPARQHP